MTQRAQAGETEAEARVRQLEAELETVRRELRAAQEKQRTGDESFRRFSESGLLAIAAFEFAGKIRFANEAFARMVGYSTQELAGGTLCWDDFIPPEWAPRVAEAVAALKSRGNCEPFEAEYLRRDGTRFWALFTGVRIDDQGAVGFLLDTTGRRQAEEALRESEARLAGIIGSAMDALVTIDEAQRIQVFNAAAETMFCCRAADVLGQPIDRFIPERFRERHRAHIEGFRRTGTTSRSMTSPGTLVALRADGEEFPIEATISQVSVGGKKLFTVIVRDVTDRKRAEEALRESEARYRALVEALSQAVWRLDGAGRPVEPQSWWTALTGQTERASGPWGWLEALHPEDRERVRAAWEQARKARTPLAVEYRVRDETGEYRHVSVRGVPRGMSPASSESGWAP